MTHKNKKCPDGTNVKGTNELNQLNYTTKEKLDPEYKIAAEAELNQIRKGNYNYEGLKG